MPTTEDYSSSVGVKGFGDPHRQILARLQSLGDAIGAGGRDAVAAELEALQVVVAAHFADEQRRMEEEDHQNREAHGRAHEIGLQAIRRAMQAHDRGGLSYRTLDLVERAARWLDTHLRAEDPRQGVFQALQAEALGGREGWAVGPAAGSGMG
jgi:hemerythrin-like metal-binding protein